MTSLYLVIDYKLSSGGLPTCSYDGLSHCWLSLYPRCSGHCCTPAACRTPTPRPPPQQGTCPGCLTVYAENFHEETWRTYSLFLFTNIDNQTGNFIICESLSLCVKCSRMELCCLLTLKSLILNSLSLSLFTMFTFQYCLMNISIKYKYSIHLRTSFIIAANTDAGCTESRILIVSRKYKS